jgi:hypothetical protein
VTTGRVQKVVEVGMSIFVFVVHFAILEKEVARVCRLCSVSYFSKYGWRCRMGPLYGVSSIEGQLSL